MSENHATEEKSTCGCGGAYGSGHGKKRTAGGPARHVDSPAAQERKAEGHIDLSEGRLNLGLRTSK